MLGFWCVITRQHHHHKCHCRQTLTPVHLQVFRPFVSAGFVEFVYGGREVGEALTHHPLVESIHLTGSADTYNAIVWGSPTAKVGVVA